MYAALREQRTVEQALGRELQESGFAERECSGKLEEIGRSREVAREGRNLARINGRACPVSVIRQVGELLVDLHGQHEPQSLLRDEHRFTRTLGLRPRGRVVDLRERCGLRQRRRLPLRGRLGVVEAFAAAIQRVRIDTLTGVDRVEALRATAVDGVEAMGVVLRLRGNPAEQSEHHRGDA